MTKNNRLLLLVSIIIAYTFTLGVLKQYELLDSIILYFVSLIMIILTTLLSANVQLRFGAKYVDPGKKHNEDPTNIGASIFMPVMFAVHFYSFGELSGIYLIILYAISITMVLYLLVSYIFDYIIINEDGISGSYITQPKKVEIKYSEIEKVVFSTTMNNLVLHGNGKKVYVDIALVDSKLILNTLTKNIDHALLEEAFTKLEKYYKTFKMGINLTELDYFNK